MCLDMFDEMVMDRLDCGHLVCTNCCGEIWAHAVEAAMASRQKQTTVDICMYRCEEARVVLNDLHDDADDPAEELRCCTRHHAYKAVLMGATSVASASLIFVFIWLSRFNGG